MVGLRLRPALAERRVREPRRMAEVGDVEERELRAGRLVPGRPTSSPDPEQQVVADRVQVGRVAGQLELAEHARPRRVGDVDRVERVDLLERDDVRGRADEPDRVDALALAEVADAADLVERAGARGAASSATTRSSRSSRTTRARRCSRRAGRRRTRTATIGSAGSPTPGRCRGSACGRVGDVEAVDGGGDVRAAASSASRAAAARPSARSRGTGCSGEA